MKCSSRRNCNRVSWPVWVESLEGRLNEVQLPKELQHGRATQLGKAGIASMKCSSRRNCNTGAGASIA